MKECILAWLKYTFSFAFFYISGTSAAKKNLSKFGFQWCWQHVGWAREAIPNTCFRRRRAHVHECVRSERKVVAKEGDSTLVHGHMYQRTRCWAAPTHKINSKLVLQTLSSPGRLRAYLLRDLLQSFFLEESLPPNFMTAVNLQVPFCQKLLWALAGL